MKAADSDREIVAHAPAGQNVLGIGGVRFDFLPQPPDGDVHRPLVIAYVAVIPDLLHQVDAGVDLVGVAGKESQKLIFPGGQLQRCTVPENLMAVRVDGEPAGHRHGRFGGAGGSGGVHGRAADVGPHPGDELPHGKGAW